MFYSLILYIYLYVVSEDTQEDCQMEIAPENEDVSNQDELSTDQSQNLSEHLNKGK